MKKICVKCGHTNSLKSVDSLTECPKCGVIYAKAEARAERIKQEEKRQAESPSSGGKNFISFLVLGGLACLIFYCYFGRGPAREHEKLAERPVVEQQESPKPTSIVQRGPEPSGLNLTRKEKEVEVSGIRKSSVSDSRARPPATTTEKKTISYYLAESTISQGEKVVLTEHLSAGRHTVFFFYADW